MDPHVSILARSVLPCNHKQPCGRLFQSDSRFLRSLEVPTYFNLDGDGSHAEDKKSFESDKGPLSISAIQQAHLLQHNLKTNHGKTIHDHCYIDQEDAFGWAGGFADFPLYRSRSVFVRA